MRFLILIAFIFLQACGSNPATTAQANSGLKNILVIGDSVSGGYYPPLQEILKKEYNVRHIGDGTGVSETYMDNSCNTFFTLEHLDLWFNLQPSEIVIWNNGLWDAFDPAQIGPNPIFPSRYYSSTLLEYEENIQTIAARIKAKPGVERIIFLTTTNIQKGGAGPFREGWELQLNEIAKRVLPPMGIEVVDLYNFEIGHPAWHVSDGDVHYNTYGSARMAGFIANAVRGGK